MSIELKRGTYLLNTDGGMASDGRRRAGDPPGVAAIGVVLREPNLRELATVSRSIGPATHNAAEYRALIRGLRLARRKGIERIRVYMDSELVVDQMSGASAVQNHGLKKLHKVAKELEAQFASIRISWVPRELNVEADLLVQKALKRALARIAS